MVPKCKWGMKKFQRGVLHPVGFWHDAFGLDPEAVLLSAAYAAVLIQDNLTPVRISHAAVATLIQDDSTPVRISQGAVAVLYSV
jgi:hypothetical protein